MKKKNWIYPGILLLLLITAPPAKAFKEQGKYFDFLENRGQWQPDIKYKTKIPGGMLHLTDNGFDYFYASEKEMQYLEHLMEKGRNVDSETIHLHNYQVHYVGANKRITYTSEEKRKQYINYFSGKDTLSWKGGLNLFGKINQHNIYNGIDVTVYSSGTSLKYDFNIAPGGAVSDIQLEFKGVVPTLTKEGNLHLKTTVNEITEQAPYAYQIIDGKEVPVPCQFQLKKGILSFVLPKGYHPLYNLIIDPELVFTTFSGAGNFNAGYFSFCTTYDALGCLYTAGVPVRGPAYNLPPRWPVTPGAFQTTYSTIYEPMVCINKYDAKGSELIYSTYYGGSGPNDLPHTMIVNQQGELILAGSTGSFNLPVTSGCLDSTKSGGTDIYIAHFNSEGTALIGATYIGGNIGNSINGIDLFSTFGLTAANQNKLSPIEMALDKAGNIWVVSNTSSSDFPITANAFQSKIGGGNCDGVVFALDPTCSSLLFGSFIGGSHFDAAYGIQFNHAGNVVICGGTKSNNFPTTKEAYKSNAPGSGDWEGFVLIFNPVSGELLHSTYLGTSADDQAVNLQIDPSDNVYVLGRTFGNYPISKDVYALPGRDLFIDKLSPNLKSSLLSTRLGNPQHHRSSFFPTSFLVDNCTNVYVTGLSAIYTTPLSDMPLSNDAFQTTPGNFWFGVLKPEFSDLLFGTYYGRAHDSLAGINGDHTHVGANHMDPQGILYHSLCVNSSDYPGTTTQSWAQFNNNKIGQDIVSFKFAFQLAGVTSGFNLAPGQKDSGCVPFTIQLENKATMATTYTWDFGDGSPLSYELSPPHTYTKKGVYKLSLHAHNDTTCIMDDTSYRTITVFDPESPDITLNDTLICKATDEVELHVLVNNPSIHNQFRWQPAAAIKGSADKDRVTINPAHSNSYSVTVWDTIAGFCGYATSDTIHIDYKPRSLLLHNKDTLVCKGTTVQFSLSGTPGYTYAWSPAGNIENPALQNPTITANQTETFTVSASYPGCTDTTQSITINVDLPESVSFDTHPNQICVGESVSFTPHTDSTFTQLHWQLGDEIEMTVQQDSVLHHAYSTAGRLPVTLRTSFRACPQSTFTDTVYVYAPPLISLGPDTSLCLAGSPILLKNLHDLPMGAIKYEWNTGDTGNTLKVVQPGIYSLTLSTAPLGCSSTESITVSDDCYLDVPNVFTPNSDGINDYFLPRPLLSRNLSHFQMKVFNRWGQLIFHTTQLNGRGWDGKWNEMEQPEGVYLYLIEAEINTGKLEKHQGNLTLIR